jgi:hypothetical protein
MEAKLVQLFGALFLAGPPISLPQLIVSIVLIFVLIFGLGFILNMILKTTWLPIVLYIGVVAYLALDLKTAYLPDYLWFLAGLSGAILSGWTIKILRAKGYRMF